MNPYILPDMSIGRVPKSILRFPTQIDFVKLTQHTGVTMTIPTGANYVNICPAPTIAVFVNYESNTIASGLYQSTSINVTPPNTCSGLRAEQITKETMRALTGLTKMGVISPSLATVTLSWYA